jgi:hypothetical protein
MRVPRPFLATFRFELHGVRSTYLVALICAAAGFVAPLAPGLDFVDLVDGWRASAIRISTPLVALILVPALARTWTGGLRTGTLSFLFSQPISSGALWCARFASSLVIAVGVLCLSLLPALPWAIRAVSRARWRDWPDAAVILVTLSIAVVVGIAVLNAVSLLARQPRVAGALVLLVAAALITVVSFFGWWTVAGLRDDWSGFQHWSGLAELLQSLPSTSVEPLVAVGAVAGTVLGFLAASFRQLTQGRTDPARARRLFLRSFGVALFFSTVIPGSLLWWALHPSPSALDPAFRLFEAPRPSGWLVAAGELKLRGDDIGIFLLEAPTGRWFTVLAGSLDYHFDARDVFTISEDGAQAVVSRLNNREGAPPLVRQIDLANRMQRSIEIRSDQSSFLRPIAALRSGQLLAVEKHHAAIFDLENGSRVCASSASVPRSRLLGTMLVSESPTGDVFILQDAGGARFGCGGSREEQAVFVRIDPATCDVRVLAFCAPGAQASRSLALDAEAGVGLTLTYLPGERSARELRRHDLESGETTTLMKLGDSSERRFSTDVSAAFLRDRSVLVTWTEVSRSRAAVLSPGGSLLRSWVLPSGRSAPLAQLNSGRIVLAHWESETPFGRVLALDANSGDIQSLQRELVTREGWLARSGRLPQSAIAEDVESGSPVVIFQDGSINPLHLRWLP